MFFLSVNVRGGGAVITVVQRRYVLLYENVGVVAYRKELCKRAIVVMRLFISKWLSLSKVPALKSSCAI